MKRQDVKVGEEYACRQGSYGQFARVLIRAEETRQTQTRGSSWGGGTPRTERGFTGKVIEAGAWGGFSTKGAVVFVRGRDIDHLWSEEEEGRKARAEHEAQQKAEMRADKAERVDFLMRLRAVGIDAGIERMVEGYRYSQRSERLCVYRDALRRLIEIAERDIVGIAGDAIDDYAAKLGAALPNDPRHIEARGEALAEIGEGIAVTDAEITVSGDA
jgi:hypothetical protein